MKLFIHPEYRALAAPLQPSSFLALERSCLKLGILQPIVHDRDGAILDGMHRFKIAQKHGLSFDTVQREWNSEQEKRAWVAGQRLLHNRFTNQQLVLSRYNLMELQEGTIEERATRLAEQYGDPNIKKSTIIKRFKDAHDYGTLANSERVSRPLYDYIWSGNPILARDLRALAKLTHRQQEVALRKRVSKGLPWHRCIRAVKVEEPIDGLDNLLLLMRRAKASLGSFKRWAQLEQQNGSDVGRMLTKEQLEEVADWERKLRDMMGDVNARKA